MRTTTILFAVLLCVQLVVAVNIRHLARSDDGTESDARSANEIVGATVSDLQARLEQLSDGNGGDAAGQLDALRSLNAAVDIALRNAKEIRSTLEAVQATTAKSNRPQQQQQQQLQEEQ